MRVHIITNSDGDIFFWERLSEYMPSDWTLTFGTHYLDKDLAVASRSDIVISYTPVVPQLYSFLRDLKLIKGDRVTICIHPHEGYYAYESISEYLNKRSLVEGSFRTSSQVTYDFVDRFYFWGTIHLAEWAPHLVAFRGLRQEAVIGVGSVYHEYSKKRLRVAEKRTVLYCSGGLGYSLYSDSDFELGGDSTGDKSLSESKIEYLKRAREACIDDRETIYRKIMDLAKKNKGVLFIFRLHPNEVRHLDDLDGPESRQHKGRMSFKRLLEEIECISNIQVVRTKKKITADELDGISALIHHGSTTAVQAAYYNVPSVMIRFPSLEAFEKEESQYSGFSQLPVACPGESLVTPETLDSVLEITKESVVRLNVDQEKKKRFANLMYLPRLSSFGDKEADLSALSDERSFALSNIGYDLRRLKMERRERSHRRTRGAMRAAKSIVAVRVRAAVASARAAMGRTQ